ncbi:Respiratory supercomplex factor 2, mitochondrial [Candida viswanathii]|uniref:Respiratory supercomplex factor 2, mitochondrial n=1 Tax=Candida viswanathii TaxID=5486 RepID=A0A367YJC1_9ASCO|nr:Respiratory supercomplex factor 2, mitochondrial [Candida viswanathii]
MKLISEQEALEHKQHIFKQCYKGCVVGTVVGLGLVLYMKFKQSVKYNSYNWTIKACMVGMPVIGCATFASLRGSARFFDSRYRADHLSNEKRYKKEHLEELSVSEKIIYKLNQHKYEVVVGAWAGCLYASWRIINRDLLLTRTQKLVQARVLAQAFALGILLSTIYLSMKEVELQKKLPRASPNWEKVLHEQGSL